MPEKQPNPHKKPLPTTDANPLGQPEPKSFSGITIDGVFMSPRRFDSDTRADIAEKEERIRKHLS